MIDMFVVACTTPSVGGLWGGDISSTGVAGSSSRFRLRESCDDAEDVGDVGEDEDEKDEGEGAGEGWELIDKVTRLGVAEAEAMPVTDPM